ncbi:MAG: type II toxin-antitoxin system RelE/ParE family toxin [Planctomycetota bacterium]|nr:type II toxin-antitoxin system RelE/ParE family toxin [Planctomycetota bacterium]MDI6787425.1 type II toxin-antitoxin system RelE/ParE family toxin [Planctomycetota bacterium]
MKYRILYTARAEEDILNLEPVIQKRIGSKLLQMGSNPFYYAEHLTDPRIGTYRFRIGDYRVIFDVKGDELIILRIGHRREIYRK